MTTKTIEAGIAAKNKTTKRKSKVSKVSKVEKTTKILKNAISQPSKKGRISIAEKIYSEYQSLISTDVNFPLKNLRFISSDIQLEMLENLNREVTPSQATKLSKSIKAMGNIRPVIVTKMKFKSNSYKYYMLDGQHNYTALKSLNAPEIPIVEVPVNSIKSLVRMIALLNSSSKSWTLKDYVTAWSNIHEDYITLENLYNEFDIELSIVSAICSGNSVAASGPGTSLIKSGEFRIHNLEQSRQKLSDINEILSLLPRMDRAANRYFILSLINVFNEVTYTRKEHKKLLDYVEENKEVLKFAIANVATLKDYLLKAFQ